MTPPDPTADDGALDEVERIFLEWTEADERGEAVPVEDLFVRYPRHAEALAHLIADYESNLQAETRKDVLAAGDIATLPDRSGGDAGLPERFGPWLIEAFVARGGGGTLYRARHEERVQQVALKVVDVDRLIDRRDLERFRREADLLRGLDIVGVVPVLDAGEEDGRAWMALKWIDGANLGQAARAAADRDHVLHPLSRRVGLIARLARTFATIHGHGILHRDIKPSNILVDRVGEPLVIDFGISRAPAVAELTGPLDAVMGTPRYLAPEVVRDGNEAVSERSDVYGLGLTLHELLVGAPAYDAPTAEALFQKMRGGEAPRLRRVDPSLPAALEAIVARAIHPDPARRHRSMESLADDLEAWLDGRSILPETARIGGPWGRFGLWRARHRVPLVSVAATLAILLTVFGADLVRDRLAIGALHEVLEPFVYVPAELRPDEHAEVAEVLRVVRSDPRAYPVRLREDLAWWLHSAADFEGALELLGAAEPDEPDSVRFLRELVRAHLLHFKEGERGEEAALRGPDGEPLEGQGGRSEVREVVGLFGHGDDTARRRLRLRPLSQEILDPIIARMREAPVSARLRSLEARVLAASLPTHSEPERLRPRVARLITLAEELAEAPEPLGRWAAWDAGLASLATGDALRARGLIDHAAGAAFRPPQLLAARALALSHAGEVEAASEAFARAHEAWLEAGLTGSSAASRPQAGMPARRFFGHWARHELERGRVAEVHRVLEASSVLVSEGAEPLWQFSALREILRARALFANGEVEAALEHIESARDANGDAALFPAEQERMAFDANLSSERIARYTAEREDAVLGMPATIDDLLDAHFFGLRPYARSSVFSTAALTPTSR